MSNMKKLVIGLSLLVGVFAFAGMSFAQVVAQPSDKTSLQDEINKQSQAFGAEEGAGYGDVHLHNDPRLIVASGVQIFLSVLATLFSVYTVYGGYLWMTSAGNEERITKARSIFIHGIIGVAVVLLSYSAIYFIYHRVMVKVYQEPFGSYFNWGTVPRGTNSLEGPDPLSGGRDHLEQVVPTPEFKFKEPEE